MNNIYHFIINQLSNQIYAFGTKQHCSIERKLFDYFPLSFETAFLQHTFCVLHYVIHTAIDHQQNVLRNYLSRSDMQITQSFSYIMRTIINYVHNELI